MLDCNTKNKSNFEAFWFVFKSFCYRIFTNFPKQNWWWGDIKEPERIITKKTEYQTKFEIQFQGVNLGSRYEFCPRYFYLRNALLIKNQHLPVLSHKKTVNFQHNHSRNA